MPDQTLSQIIDKAVETTDKAAAPAAPAATSEETKVTPANGVPAPPTEVKAEPKEPQAEMTDEELANAKQLWKTLKDGGPDAEFAIDYLARRNGYDKITTPAEAETATAEIKDTLQEALGEEYGHLAKKLVPAIKDYVKQALEEGTQELKAKTDAIELEKLVGRSDSTLKTLGEEFYGAGKPIPTNVQNKMTELMNTYKPASGQTVEDYVTDMFHMATSKLGNVPLNSQQRSRVNAAKNNVTGVLDETKGRPTPSNEPKSNRSKDQKAVTLEDAIRAAMKQVEEEMTKGG